MTELRIPIPSPFHFRDLVFSHGWLRLHPFEWDEDSEVLTRTEQLPSGRVLPVVLQGSADGVTARAEASAEEWAVLGPRLRWMLAVSDDLKGFHALCENTPGLREAGTRGKGRVLRCPTVWEDLVKTLFSVNTTWQQTVAMNRNLVERYGPESQDGSRAFPPPETVAGIPAEELQAVCRVGYRAGPLAELARAVAEGRTDLEALKERSLPDEEVAARLLALKGIGPYAAANVMLLLGRYDYLPVDSWFRKTVRDGWFEGRDVPDRDLVAAFERFRPYRTLVYYFYDWKGANRPDEW